MRYVAVLLFCAAMVASAANTASARTRLYLHRTGPGVIVVPNPSGYGEPQVLVRRYELLLDQYLAPPDYWRPTYRGCAYVHRACSTHRRR